tara:strand:- start:966 stop:1721 length:756 start_codon:yes stop_codon:yes gene_type:complete
MSNNNVAMKDDRENLSKVIQANQPKTKSFDPLQNSIQTLQVNEKTLTNYIEQIKTNIYVGKKAMYFVARDVYDAQQSLSTPDFKRLVDNFKWNGSTQSKILRIGASNNLFKIYKEGHLPSNWTTLYELSILTDAEFKKVKHLLEPDVSWNKIAKELGKKDTPDPNWLLNFLNLEVDKRKVTVADFVKTLTAIKKDLKKYKVVKVVDDNKEKVQKSIERYITSLNNKQKKADKEAKKKENKRKTKEIIKNAA